MTYSGDGTGVGKARMISAIIMHNLNKGRKRALWISASHDLYESALAELRILGYDKPLLTLDKMNSNNEGVVFITYNGLISSGRKRGRGRESRFHQVLNFLKPDFDGLVSYTRI